MFIPENPTLLIFPNKHQLFLKKGGGRERMDKPSVPIQQSKNGSTWKCSRCTWTNPHSQPSCGLCSGHKSSSTSKPSDSLLTELLLLKFSLKPGHSSLSKSGTLSNDHSVNFTRTHNLFQLIHCKKQPN